MTLNQRNTIPKLSEFVYVSLDRQLQELLFMQTAIEALNWPEAYFICEPCRNMTTTFVKSY